ncbi:MAG: hypothetical protein QOF63_1671 [Thermoanaerobaculia bacterium]|nr:hypothetical protein [Thermoanaerobaculia bacterium]
MLTTTPIDAHLPLVIALVLACAWAARGTRWAAAIQCAVPLLIAAMMTIADERTRLMAYGIIVAAAFAAAVIATAYETERWRLAGWPGGVSPPMVVLAVIGVIILRWIPLRDVHVVKELILLAGCVILLFVIRRRDAAEPAGETPALLAVLVLAAVTPIPPGKMALLPLTAAALVFVTRRVPQVAVAAFFLVCAFFARYSLATIYIAMAIVFLTPFLHRVKALTYATAITIFALWPWSGIIARALPIVRNYEPTGDLRPVGVALAPSEARTIDVPPHVRHAVVTMSGGQMERLKRGRVAGTIEAIDARGNKITRPISIGEIADFGFTRREQFFASRNALPRFSPGEIRDYGANAWVWGGGCAAIASPADITSLRVIAAPNLPHDAHLQIDSVEFPAR